MCSKDHQVSYNFPFHLEQTNSYNLFLKDQQVSATLPYHIKKLIFTICSCISHSSILSQKINFYKLFLFPGSARASLKMCARQFRGRNAGWNCVRSVRKLFRRWGINSKQGRLGTWVKASLSHMIIAGCLPH